MDICTEGRHPQSMCRERQKDSSIVAGVGEGNGQQALPESSLPAENLRTESIETPSEISQKDIFLGFVGDRVCNADHFFFSYYENFKICLCYSDSIALRY